MKASKRSLWFQFISLLEQFQLRLESVNQKWKIKLIPAGSHMFSGALRSLPDSTLSSHWLMLVLTFVLIDGCKYFGFSLSKIRVC